MMAGLIRLCLAILFFAGPGQKKFLYRKVSLSRKKLTSVSENVYHCSTWECIKVTFLEQKFACVVCLSFHLTSEGTKYLL